jgi:hypothetical protein
MPTCRQCGGAIAAVAGTAEMLALPRRSLLSDVNFLGVHDNPQSAGSRPGMCTGVLPAVATDIGLPD